jgi:hypothetical protein
MLFAHLKRILKLDRLRLRGLSGARDEFLLAAPLRTYDGLPSCACSQLLLTAEMRLHEGKTTTN